jgi:hypothetical protein
MVEEAAPSTLKRRALEISRLNPTSAVVKSGSAARQISLSDGECIQ